MTITIQSMVTRAAKELEDSGYGRTLESDWVNYFNSAIKQICTLKSDAYTVRGNVQLVSGVIQSLPTGGTRLIRPTRNMGIAGNVAGNSVRFVVLDAQNSFNESWYSQTNSDAVEDVFYDERHPLEFFVSPPAPNYYLEIIYAATPAVVTISSNFPLIDIYETPAIYFAKGFAHQANRADVDFNRGNAFMDLGFSSLGLQKGSEMELKNG